MFLSKIKVKEKATAQTGADRATGHGLFGYHAWHIVGAPLAAPESQGRYSSRLTDTAP